MEKEKTLQDLKSTLEGTSLTLFELDNKMEYLGLSSVFDEVGLINLFNNQSASWNIDNYSWYNVEFEPTQKAVKALENYYNDSIDFAKLESILESEKVKIISVDII